VIAQIILEEAAYCDPGLVRLIPCRCPWLRAHALLVVQVSEVVVPLL